MGLDVGDGLEDGLWDRRGSGQQVALGLVAVLVGLVAHTNVLALGGDPLEDSVESSSVRISQVPFLAQLNKFGLVFPPFPARA